MLHNYCKGFPCTYLVGTKHQDCQANYLKFRNHSRHPARKCRSLTDRYVVFVLMLLALVIILGSWHQLPAEAGSYTQHGHKDFYPLFPFSSQVMEYFPREEVGNSCHGSTCILSVPASGRSDGWSDGWRQHTLHDVCFTCLGMGSCRSAADPQVWDLGPRPCSVWYNPTVLHTDQPFHSKETWLVQYLNNKSFLFLLCWTT